MKYFYIKFRGYQCVVCTNQWGNAVNRLVEFVRVTKGNIGYSEQEIREEEDWYW